MASAGKVLIYRRSEQMHFFLPLYSCSFVSINPIMTSTLQSCRESSSIIDFPSLFWLQEESSIKLEEQGSRFGLSSEDLTNTSKQVRAAYRPDMQNLHQFMQLVYVCVSVSVDFSGRLWHSSQSSTTKADSKEIPPREPEPGDWTSSSCHAFSSTCQTKPKVSKGFKF
ncbi:hypothetical protein ILYODFUR_011100 [Ilyodon furcidens]|uniref:Uncharacterized protein n=1 Tax=Ilyodon furcidens TaxID=33524 RepID=A0ABV0V3T0_9TELE